MNKREMKRKVNALWKELDKATDVFYKAKEHMENAEDKKAMLWNKIQELDDKIAKFND